VTHHPSTTSFDTPIALPDKPRAETVGPKDPELRTRLRVAGLRPTVQAKVTEDEHDKHLEQLDLMLDSRKAGGFRRIRHADGSITAVRPGEADVTEPAAGVEPDASVLERAQSRFGDAPR